MSARTAPDAQPPAEVWWSACGLLLALPESPGQFEVIDYDENIAGWYVNSEPFSGLPADAVRLTADEMAADILDANERMGEALVAIGMALGMSAPRTGATWGAPEILARIAATPAPAALAGTTTPTDERADLLERLNQVIDLSRRLDADDLDPSVEPITDPERDVWGAAALLHSALHRYGIAVRDEYWALLASTPTEETDRNV